VLSGCVPENLPAASPSTYCGSVWDDLELVSTPNEGLDLRSGARLLTFDGCCLPNGLCGAQLASPRENPNSIDLHLGCVSFDRLRAGLIRVERLGGLLGLPHPPYCNQADGMPLKEGDARVLVGVPAHVCGCGTNVTNEAAATPCLNRMPTTVCGLEPTSEADLKELPEYACGCPAMRTFACLPGTSADTCGQRPIGASSPELAGIPASVCGCGAGVVAKDASKPCLSNVEASTCGNRP
jgi:hypothetical protein